MRLLILQRGSAFTLSRHHKNINGWARLRKQVFDRDEYKCVICGKHKGRLECDHIIPLAKGGSNRMDNLRAVCRDCHFELTSQENRTYNTTYQRDWDRFLRQKRGKRHATCL